MMKKSITILLVVCAILFSETISAQKKVMGYFPYYRSASDINSVDFDNLTDVVFAFMLGNATTGALYYPNNDNTLFKSLANAADAKGVGVWISVGGGGWPTPQMVAAINANQTKFINDIVAFLAGNNSANMILKGVDVDWEFPKTTVDKNLHEAFICALRSAMDVQEGKDGNEYTLSIAVGGDVKSATNHLQYINKATFACADEVVIMSYDGPASAFYNNHHSTLQMAQDNITAWANAGCPKSKMILALPFYAANAAQTKADTYEALVGYFPGVDLLSKDDHLGWYYNGQQTLEDKIDLICSEGGLGVTVWEITQDVDAGGAKALLPIVYSHMQSSSCALTTDIEDGTESIDVLRVFPNPTENTVQIVGLDEKLTEAKIFDTSGKLIETTHLSKISNVVNLINYQNGLYFIQLQHEGKVNILKVSKL